MKLSFRRTFWVALALSFVADAHAANIDPYPIMRPDWATREQWITACQNAPRAFIDDRKDGPKGQISLLSHIQYTPSERNQQNCGNCWSWAGTGVMEIALDVQNAIKDRLSVQLLVTCGGKTKCGCQGGWLQDVVTFYQGTAYAVPWSNPNAYFQNGNGDCNNTCGDIGTSPNYPITSIDLQTIETQSVNQNTAIGNIKNVLNQNKAVWFGFFLPRQADWNTFFSFWDYQTENALYDPSGAYNQTWDEGGGGHAVLVVGYNDDDADPAKHYWLMLNSWGTARGGIRPNGLMRWKMNMTCNAVGYDRGQSQYLFFWQTLNMNYAGSNSKPVVATSSATAVNSSSATLNGTLNPKGLATTYGFEYGLTTGYSSTTAVRSAGSGSSPVTCAEFISGLSAANTYHCRLVASNSAGKAYGVDQTFTTTSGGTPVPPEATTQAASSINASSAVLNGTVNPHGQSTACYFQYGMTTSYGLRTASENVGTNPVPHNVAQSIVALLTNTLYHCRLVATNSAGISYGADVAFSTKAASDILFSEGFESGYLPDWSQYYERRDYYSGKYIEWIFQSGGYWDNPVNAHSGNYNAFFFDMDFYAATDLITPAISLGSSYNEVTLSFWHYMAEDFWWGNQDELYVYWSPSGSPGSWQLLAGYSNNVPEWTQRTMTLPCATGTCYIGFQGISYWGHGIALDDIQIKGVTQPAPLSGMVAQWRKAWEDFDQNYSYFSYKGIDWAPVFNAHTNDFAQVQDGSAFAAQLNNVLQMLHDWHVAVQMPDATWLGYNGSYTNNYPSGYWTNYTRGMPYQDVRGAHVIYHAWVGGNLAHIAVDTMDTTAFAAISDDDINAIFETYKTAAGIILDIRYNNGGNENNALRVASHFTSVPRTYGYTRTRIAGSNHNAFTPFSAKTVAPATGRLFTNNVVCLIGQRVMSSAEWMTLMMKACPQVTLMGDRTRGASGNPAQFEQPSIGVNYKVSSWIAYDANQVPFEDVGIAPQVMIPPGSASVDNALRRDYVLEQAMAWLKSVKLDIARTSAGSGLVISWPGETNQWYTLLRTTNLSRSEWTLAPGWTSNRLGTAGLMIYTNTLPRPFEAYRILRSY